MSRRTIIGASLIALSTLSAPTMAWAHVSDATVNNKGQLVADGRAAVLTGTIRCDANEQASVSVLLSQTKGQESVYGVGYDEVGACTGFSQGWSVTVTAVDEATFKNGPAAARMEACSGVPFDPSDPDPEFHSDCEVITQTVHLRR